MKKEAVNKMGTMPVRKLILNMGLPMILSMMLQAFYNIVDSAFVSNMPQNGEAALNALTLAFPVQMLMVAISIGTGVGTNALLSKCIGQGNMEKVSRVAGNALFLGVVIDIVFILFGIFGIDIYISSQTSNPQIMEMTRQYLGICCIVSAGIVFYSISEKMLQATGRAMYSTVAQITGAVINIIFDPILIFGYLGLPAMGVGGAAWATVIGQIASAVVGLFFHWKYNKEIKNGIRYCKPSWSIIKEIYAIGLRDAITPIVSFNQGMGSRSRVKEGIRWGIIDTLVVMGIGLVLLEIFAVPLARIFGLSGETQELCVSAIRLISLSFIFAGLNIAYQGVFQALNSGLESLLISVCRQCLFVLPVAWAFSLLARQSMEYMWLVWLTFLIAEALSAVIGAFFMARINRNIINKMEG